MTSSTIQSNSKPQVVLEEIQRHFSTPAKLGRPSLLNILVQLGLISANDMSAVIRRMEKTGSTPIQALTELKLAKKCEIQLALAIQYGYLKGSTDIQSLPLGLNTIRQPNSEIAKQIRTLRARLLTEHAMEDLSLFSLISVGSDYNGVFLAANLAASFALVGHKVLLVDGDLKRNGVGQFFSLTSEYGFSDLLAHRKALDECVVESDVTNLSLLMTGKYDRSVRELAAAGGTPRILENANEAYDITIVLTGSIDNDSESRFMWSATQTALVAAQKNTARYDELKLLQSSLRQLGVNLLGAAVLG